MTLHKYFHIFRIFFIFLSIPLCTFKFFSISHKHHNEVHVEAKTEDDDVSSLSLSNSTTNNANVLNSTVADLDTSNGNDENLNLKLKTNNTQNLREICSNQCSCDICKDASSENLSSITESRLDNKPNQENVNQSSKSTSVPTFGKYCKRCRLKINWHAQNDYKSNHTIWTGTLKQKLNNDNDPVI